jgi:hypothetical protein
MPQRLRGLERNRADDVAERRARVMQTRSVLDHDGILADDMDVLDLVEGVGSPDQAAPLGQRALVVHDKVLRLVLRNDLVIRRLLEAPEQLGFVAVAAAVEEKKQQGGVEIIAIVVAGLDHLSWRSQEAARREMRLGYGREFVFVCAFASMVEFVSMVIYRICEWTDGWMLAACARQALSAGRL